VVFTLFSVFNSIENQKTKITESGKWKQGKAVVVAAFVVVWTVLDLKLLDNIFSRSNIWLYVVICISWICCTYVVPMQNKKEPDFNLTPSFSAVGVVGFEPTTPCSQSIIFSIRLFIELYVNINKYS
jgi:hypothetical protein